MILRYGLPLLIFCTAFASAQEKRLDKATKLPTEWKEDQRLYVKGHLGVSSHQLNQLEQWLDKNGTNWIILLVQSASGESFTAADGRTYSGMDAVEMAANVATRNQTGFGELTDSRNGEKNGAVFILFLSERKFSYSGGEAHDKRGLGQSSWVGNLDRPAFRAMSNGGRIVDAAKDTVKEIDRRLTRQYTIEQQQRQRRIAEAKKLQADADKLLKEADAGLDELKSTVEKFRAAHGQPEGDLANPPIDELRHEWTTAQAEFEQGQPQAAYDAATAILSFVRAHLESLADYDTATSQFTALNQEISKVAGVHTEWGPRTTGKSPRRGWSG